MANWFGGGFNLEELVPSAVVIPAHIFPNGRTRPEMRLAIAILKTKNPLNPETKIGNRKQFRILAFYQGQKPNFTAQEVMDPYARPVGGVMGIGDQITHVWVDKEYRGDKSAVGIPNLYKELLNFARQRGIVGLAPEDATCPECGTTVPLKGEPKPCPNCGAMAQPLTSRSFRAAQAKYDWKRARGN